MVFTEEGPQAVETLTKGTRVWGLNSEETGLDLGTVTDVWQAGVDPIYTIKTNAGIFRCNGRHRLFIRRLFCGPKWEEWRNVWSRADEITSKDYLMTAAPILGLAGSTRKPKIIHPWNDGLHPEKGFNVNGALLAVVYSVSVGNPEPVYDLNVDGTATYIANGFISHNSRGFGGKCVRSDEEWVTPEGEIKTWGEMEGSTFPILAPVEGGVVTTLGIAEDNGPQTVWNITLHSGIKISRTEEHPVYSALPKNGKAILPRLRFASKINRGHLVLVPNKLVGAPKGEERADDDFAYWGVLLSDPKHAGSPPSWMLQGSEKQIKLLVNKLFSCNRHALVLDRGRYPDVEFTTHNKKIADLIARAMHRLGAPGKLRNFQSRDKYGYKRAPVLDTYAWSPLPEFIDEFFDVIGTIPGKEDICRGIQQNSKPNLWRRREAPAGYHWDAVTAINVEHGVPTTTICVPEGNMFCGPVVEHNSFLLALLSLTEQVVLGASINLLGGSGEQAQRVLQYLSGEDPNSFGVLWDSPNAPKWMHPAEFTKRESRTINGGRLKTLMASNTSIRGPHPARLRLDEVDELDIGLFDQAMGQTMASRGIPAQTVASSTHQHAFGTMSTLLQRARENNWLVHEWCISAGSMVLTSAGEIPIETVVPGSRVATRSGWRTVQHCTYVGCRDTVTLTLSNGRRLCVTPDHKMATPEGWEEAGLLLPGATLIGIAPIDGPTRTADPMPSVRTNINILGGHSVSPAAEISPRLVLPCPPFILGVGNSLQVVGIYTSAISAQMVYGHTIIERPVNLYPYPPMDVVHPVMPVPEVDTKETVTCAQGPLPNHATSIISDAATENVIKSDHVFLLHRTPGIFLPVYDIGVEECHEFTVEGVLVHNCYRENLKSNGGWLDDAEVARKKNEVTKEMWETEYENQSPNPESYAIDPAAVDNLFDKSLGVFPGRLQEHISIAPPEGIVKYYHGADWAKAKDASVLHSVAELRDGRDVLVQWSKMGRIAWPMMIGKFNDRVKKLGGPACHDSTGVGSVVNDYIKVPSYGVNLQGQSRTDIFNEFIVAVERGDQMVFPFIESMHRDFKYASWEDIFGGKHPPDSFVAAALAWEAKKRGGRLNIFRL